MIAALALAAATMATPTPAPRLLWTPTSITVSVRAARGIPRRVVPEALEEAAAIWRTAGLTLHWMIDDGGAADGSADGGCALIVSVEDAPAATAGTMMPLGWIEFDREDPTEEIHLSFNNALALMQDVKGAGEVFRLTQMERDVFLSRALGRALAHELGHYLLGSREHTKNGLMQTARAATDFFTPGRERFAIAPVQQRLIAARWARVSTLAKR
jgi:hypothetical protein